MRILENFDGTTLNGSVALLHVILDSLDVIVAAASDDAFPFPFTLWGFSMLS